MLKQSILFPKNHDIFSLIKTVNLTKTNNIREKLKYYLNKLNIFKIKK